MPRQTGKVNAGRDRKFKQADGKDRRYRLSCGQPAEKAMRRMAKGFNKTAEFP